MKQIGFVFVSEYAFPSIFEERGQGVSCFFIRYLSSHVQKTIRFEIPNRLTQHFSSEYGSYFGAVAMTPGPDARPKQGMDEWGAINVVYELKESITRGRNIFVVRTHVGCRESLWLWPQGYVMAE